MSDHERVLTNDGSYTLKSAKYGATYHSMHGAVQESMHVFIKAGLNQLSANSQIRILEVGLGTGLNLLLTVAELQEKNIDLQYDAIEPNTLNKATIDSLAYPEYLKLPWLAEINHIVHSGVHLQSVQIAPDISFRLLNTDVESVSLDADYNLVYYDAFGPGTQPELWATPVLQPLTEHVVPGGILVTYCAQGQFKRNLKALGWSIESLPGPPGKREIVRATRI